MKKNPEYYHKAQNVEDYYKLAEGYDGAELIEKLKVHLPDKSTILEVGMGPGKDLDLLLKHYNATGSDYSQIFLDNYQSDHSDADLILLNAVTLDTSRKFNAIYSNKVLMHISKEDHASSISRQKEILDGPGIILHAFWAGSGEEYFSGLRFVYYSESELREMYEKEFDILEVKIFTEMQKNDSIYLIAKLKS
ncbi:MAG: class I SAM-dependent methyltransferase [Saprospiraceae bacterium]|nr:class I SAM-dependent methyltransferase [Saprospiraceae bacterium]